MKIVFSNFVYIVLLLISHTYLVKISTRTHEEKLVKVQSYIRNLYDTAISKDELLGFRTVISFLNLDTEEIYKAQFILDGFYLVRLPKGRYLRHIVSDGYFESMERIEIDKQNSKEFENYRIYLLSNGIKRMTPSNVVTIRGFIKDATSNKLVEDKLLIGENGKVTFINQETKQVYTAKILPGGIYTATFPSGKYKRVAAFDQFSQSESIMIFRTSSNEKESTNRIFLSKEVNGFRVVLTWGGIPNDLDSHLALPSGKEVNYDNKIEGTISLDVDSTDGFGPETISVANYAPGTYVYYIQNYSAEAPIQSSAARVVVFKGNRQILDIPISNEGDPKSYFWHVFNINGYTGKLELINKIQDTAPVNPEAPKSTGEVYYNPQTSGSVINTSSTF